MVSLGEQLGFAAKATVAIIHVDDLGMCHAANEGGFSAIRNGPATCGSVMVPCPWFPEAAERARQDPSLDIGVHLTVNSEWEGYRWAPIAGARVVPSLVDEQGYMHATIEGAIAHADPTEIEIELRAQIDKALAAGIDVTHLDSHMGTLLFSPSLFAIYARLGSEYNVPILMARSRDDQLAALGGEAVRPILDAAIALTEELGLPVLDGFDSDSLSFEPGSGIEHNRTRLRTLRAGANYFVCHSAEGGAELEAITPDAHARELERVFYGGEEGRRALTELGIQTTGMREVRELLRRR